MAESGSEKVISSEKKAFTLQYLKIFSKKVQANSPGTIRNQIWNHLICLELLGLKEEPDPQLHKQWNLIYSINKKKHTKPSRKDWNSILAEALPNENRSIRHRFLAATFMKEVFLWQKILFQVLTYTFTWGAGKILACFEYPLFPWPLNRTIRQFPPFCKRLTLKGSHGTS